jgi:hypothetical protein
MRRKIEKYLGKKNGIDETSIELSEDGRFDFQGDIEGVLNAVRGRDSNGKPKKADRNRSSTKKCTAKKTIKDSQNPTGLMPMPIAYLPYGMAPPPYTGMHHMYPHEMSFGPPAAEVMMPYLPPYIQGPLHGAKTNPPTQCKPVPLAPRPLSHTECSKPDSTNNGVGTIQGKRTTPGAGKSETRPAPSSACQSSQKTAGASTPKPVSSLPRRLNSPCEDMNIHGMTPLSNFRATFESLYGNGGENSFSEFSPEDNICLNKALFADDRDARNGTSSPKTPLMKFAIGMIGSGISLNASCIKNMQVNRVSISPVATQGSKMAEATYENSQKSAMKVAKGPGTVSRSIHFADDDAIPGSITSSCPLIAITTDKQAPLTLAPTRQ